MASTSSNTDVVALVPLSGTGNAVISVPYNIETVELSFDAVYNAVAGTTGMTFTLTESVDGITYVNSPANILTTLVSNGAGVRIQSTVLVYCRGVKKNGSPLAANYLKVAWVNADATNAAAVAVSTRMHTGAL